MTNLLYGGNVHANGIRQHYLRYGGADGTRANNPPVVIVPGITSPAVTWGFVGEKLGEKFDTYIIDIRGRGLSEASDKLDYSLDAQAKDILAFSDALGLKNYSVVGHSMGGRIGMRAARAQNPNFGRLVMLDPPVSGPNRRAYPSKLPWYVDSMAQARRGMNKDAMREFCPSWTNEQLQLRSQWLHTCDERAIIESFEGFHKDDFHADIPHAKIPVLMVVAGRGDVVMEEDIVEIKTLLPTIQIAHTPNSGHMIPWDNEAELYEALGDFLGTGLK